MKIKYSALVMGVSGKLNGSVGATNKGGAYLRNKGITSNPNTTLQAAVRSRFGSLSSSFRGLTPEQIAAWNTAAADFPIIDRLGDTRYLSGLGLFVQLNTNLQSIGEDVIFVPPAKQSFPAVAAVVGLAGSTGGVLDNMAVNVEFLQAVAALEFFVVVKASPVVSASVNNTKNKQRLITSTATSAGVVTVVNPLSEYLAVFGESAPVGGKVQFEIILISPVSGEASSVFKSNAIVIATP